MTNFPEPLLFDTYMRPQIWGGDRLPRLLGMPPVGESSPGENPLSTKPIPFGEAWVLSTLPEHFSRVTSGTSRGETLAELWDHSRSELFGSDGASAEFPWLVKWLDCHDDLSLQVHPDDTAAQSMLGQSHGKSEAWVVVSVEPNARICTGLIPGVTRPQFESHLVAGTVDECLNSFEPRVGDCLSLPAGTVHTARGVLLAEIQQPSDTTFRLFDWDRLDRTGRPRPLHRELGLNVVDWQQGPIAPVIATPKRLAASGVVGEVLLETDWVRLERFTMSRTWTAMVTGELTAWMVLAGNAQLFDLANDTRHELPRGATVLIPAGVGEIEWSPMRNDENCTLLCISQPRDGRSR